MSVLMSTYNGERFLKEQLDSVLTQTHENFNLLIRDDGSTDRTKDLLSEYGHAYPNVRIIFGEHKGLPASYFELLESADPRSDYVAFCDQDDVWLPDKLQRAVHLLQREARDVPALYCSSVQLVNTQLRYIGQSPAPQAVGLHNAIVENVVVGSTAVMNRAAWALVRGRSVEHAQMHDWWCYLVISALGQILFDPYPSMLYRQHGRNAVGWSGPTRSWLVGAAKSLVSSSTGPYRRQAREMLEKYRDVLGPAQNGLLLQFVRTRSLLERLSYAVVFQTARQRRVDDWKFRARILMDLY